MTKEQRQAVYAVLLLEWLVVWQYNPIQSVEQLATAAVFILAFLIVRLGV